MCNFCESVKSQDVGFFFSPSSRSVKTSCHSRLIVIQGADSGHDTSDKTQTVWECQTKAVIGNCWGSFMMRGYNKLLKYNTIQFLRYIWVIYIYIKSCYIDIAWLIWCNRMILCAKIIGCDQNCREKRVVLLKCRWNEGSFLGEECQG